MGIVNRCAVGISAKEPVREWAQAVAPESQCAWGNDPSLYLIPEYSTDVEAEEVLQEAFEEIFATELDSWCTDPDAWPKERTYELFRQWFDVVFFPVVDDMVEDEELTNEPSEADRAFFEEVRRKLQDQDSAGKGFGDSQTK